MSSHIRGVPNTLIQQGDRGSKAQSTNHRAPAPGEVAKAPGGSDSVTLTDTAATLKEIETALASVPVADPQRVGNVRAALAEGRYEVNPGRVADKMIELESQIDAASE